jgi:hypothetical protein
MGYTWIVEQAVRKERKWVSFVVIIAAVEVFSMGLTSQPNPEEAGSCARNVTGIRSLQDL